MEFSAFTMLCNPQLYLVPKSCFPSRERKTCLPHKPSRKSKILSFAVQLVFLNILDLCFFHHQCLHQSRSAAPIPSHHLKNNNSPLDLFSKLISFLSSNLKEIFVVFKVYKSYMTILGEDGRLSTSNFHP